MERNIIGNLKMNILTVAERERYLESFEKEFSQLELNNSKIFLAVPAIHLEEFSKKIKIKNVFFGAQNIFWEERGSFTGEISAKMIKNFGGDFVIIGHSERKKYFEEKNDDINKKIKSALENNLIPICCVGENKKERDKNLTANVIISQMEQYFKDISSLKASQMVIAYEPIWSVGSDEIPSSDEILEVKVLIKKTLSKIYSMEIVEKIKIVYGGSVKSKTVNQVCIQPSMDGVLVGRESLIPFEFSKIADLIDKF